MKLNGTFTWINDCSKSSSEVMEVFFWIDDGEGDLPLEQDGAQFHAGVPAPDDDDVPLGQLFRRQFSTHDLADQGTDLE